MNKGPVLLRSILKKARSSAFPIVFVVAGSGQIARCAVDGGAHFLMILSAGLYRMAGVSSLGSFMPFGNANDQTEELLRKQIMPRIGAFPVVAGIMVSDPILTLEKRFQRLNELGLAGVTNWPAVGVIQGRFGEALAKEGFSVDAEIEMLQEAKESGFVTLGFAVSTPDAVAMAKSGVDALVLNAGRTHETKDIYEKGDRIQYAVVKVNEMLKAIKATGTQPICLFFGGSITSPEDTAELYRRTEIEGFGGGSAFERIPVTKIVTNMIRQFCSVPLHSETPSFGEGMGEMVGASPVMLKLFNLIKKVAPYDVNVCIEGESGVGKELVAIQLHHLSHRASQPFITLNCGAIPDTLLESEFFGHERGAFTGAVSRRLGKFELADHGTLFLDEVAELSPKAQVSLLRVIQQKEMSRVGGDKKIPVDVRIVAATHQDLSDLVGQGRFRADLYYRLNAITLKVPPLRSHTEDIPALVNEILNELGPQFGKRILGITPDFMSRLMNYTWPGNVRELRHVLSRALLLEDVLILQGEDFPPYPVSGLQESELEGFFRTQGAGRQTDNSTLIKALKITNGNKSKAAKLLGVSRKTLYFKLGKLSQGSFK